MVHETTKSLLFYLDIRTRSGGTIESPQFSFPDNLIGLNPQNGELTRLTMQGASIEYTFYQTETFNNKFLVIEVIAGQVPDNRIITIDVGIIELTQRLNAGELCTYFVTYVANTNQLKCIATPKIPNSTAGGVTFNYNADEVFNLLGANIEESANEIMGLKNNVTIDLSSTGNNTLECQSTVPITMSPGVENLYVTISSSCSNYGNANIANVFTSSNILAKIPVASPPFSTLYFYDLNSNFSTSTIITNKHLDNLDIALFNERFTRIEPRKNWSLTIKIEIIRPRAENKTTQLLAELLDITKLKFMKKDKDKSK
jgi:hypothetical protein